MLLFSLPLSCLLRPSKSNKDIKQGSAVFTFIILTRFNQDLYQRSLQVESSASGASDSTKKKFPWLPK